jgi:hypothetical protein
MSTKTKNVPMTLPVFKRHARAAGFKPLDTDRDQLSLETKNCPSLEDFRYGIVLEFSEGSFDVYLSDEGALARSFPNGLSPTQKTFHTICMQREKEAEAALKKGAKSLDALAKQLPLLHHLVVDLNNALHQFNKASEDR